MENLKPVSWKLTIKPDAEAGFDAFELCKKKSILGAGWSKAYLEEQASNINDAKNLVNRHFKEWPAPLRRLLEEVNCGDHVWLHYKGRYYLCKVGDGQLFGNDIATDFLRYDLGHAVIASWVEVPEQLVCGSIQRGTIAPAMIQRINIDKKTFEYHRKLFLELKENPNWLPNFDHLQLTSHLKSIDSDLLFSQMSPDDVEDLVSSFLQVRGWVLVKSSCFRSKPVFEFSMQNRKGKICLVQVKSGKNPDPLCSNKYAEYIKPNQEVFLFSTTPLALNEKKLEGITRLTKKELYNWSTENHWALTPALKTRLLLSLLS